MVERRKSNKLTFHFGVLHIGAKVWMALIALFLIVAGYLLANIYGGANYSTFCYAIIGVLTVFSGGNILQKYSGFNTFSGGYNTTSQNFGGPPLNQYPSYNPSSGTAGPIQPSQINQPTIGK